MQNKGLSMTGGAKSVKQFIIQVDRPNKQSIWFGGFPAHSWAFGGRRSAQRCGRAGRWWWRPSGTPRGTPLPRNREQRTEWTDSLDRRGQAARRCWGRTCRVPGHGGDLNHMSTPKEKSFKLEWREGSGCGTLECWVFWNYPIGRFYSLAPVKKTNTPKIEKE